MAQNAFEGVINLERLRSFRRNQGEPPQFFVEIFRAIAASLQDEDGHGDAHHDPE